MEEAKEKYKENKKRLEESRKQELAKLKELNQERRLEVIRTHLTNTADILISVANQIKAKADSSEKLTDTEAQQIIAEMNDRITKLEDAKIKIAAAKTLQEVKDASRYIRENTGEIRRNVIAHIARLKQGQTPDASTTTQETTTTSIISEATTSTIPTTALAGGVE